VITQGGTWKGISADGNACKPKSAQKNILQCKIGVDHVLGVLLSGYHMSRLAAGDSILPSCPAAACLNSTCGARAACLWQVYPCWDVRAAEKCRTTGAGCRQQQAVIVAPKPWQPRLHAIRQAHPHTSRQWHETARCTSHCSCPHSCWQSLQSLDGTACL